MFRRHIDFSNPNIWSISIRESLHQLAAGDMHVQITEATQEEKDRLLRASFLKASSGGRELLQRVAAIDNWAAERLKPKDESFEGFKLRFATIAYDAEPQSITTEPLSRPPTPPDSFLALSYCWHYENWRADISSLLRTTFDVSREAEYPIVPAIWNALLDERLHPKESIWFDQRSIDQHNPAEQADAIACMDFVYASARKVVVVLEDVAISSQEADALIEYGHEHANPASYSGDEFDEWSKESKFDALVSSACFKIEEARWFRRAWCSHEFRAGNDHVFLVPVTETTLPTMMSIGTLRATQCRVLHFGTRFFSAILTCRSKWKDPLLLKSALYGLNPDQGSRLTTDLERCGSEGPFDPNYIHDKITSPNHQDQVSYMSIFSEMLGRGASSMKDRLANALNLMFSGLSYANLPVDVGLAEATFIINVLSLASGDANTLVSPGSKVKVNTEPLPGRSFREISWATVPREDPLDRPFRLDKSSLDVLVTPEGLELSVLQIANSETFVRSDQSFNRGIASQILKTYSVEIQRRKDAGIRPHSPLSVSEVSSALFADRVTGVLSAIIGFGVKHWTWATNCAAALSRLPGEGVDSKGQAAAIKAIIEMTYSSTVKVERELLFKPDKDPGTKMFKEIDYVMEFATRAVRTLGGSPEYLDFDSVVDPAFEIVICLSLKSTKVRRADMVFVPKGPWRKKLYLVIPEPAMDSSEFPMDVQRAWILERWKNGGGEGRDVRSEERPEFRLLGKTAMVGPRWKDYITDVSHIKRVMVPG